MEIHNRPRPYETQHLKDEDIINSYIQRIGKSYIDLFVRNIDLELGDPFVLILFLWAWIYLEYKQRINESAVPSGDSNGGWNWGAGVTINYPAS